MRAATSAAVRHRETTRAVGRARLVGGMRRRRPRALDRVEQLHAAGRAPRGCDRQKWVGVAKATARLPRRTTTRRAGPDHRMASSVRCDVAQEREGPASQGAVSESVCRRVCLQICETARAVTP